MLKRNIQYAIRIKHEFPYFGGRSLSTNYKRVMLSRLTLSPTKLMKHYHSFCDEVLEYYKVYYKHKDIIYIPTLIIKYNGSGELPSFNVMIIH